MNKPATYEEFAKPLRRALARLAGLVESNPDHYEFAKGFNFDLAVYNMEEALLQNKAYYIDGYLVFIDTIHPWWGGVPVLQEWFTIRVGDEGTTMSIPPALLEIADGLGCRAVLGGDSSPVGLVARAYEANGFTPLTKQYFKEVNGIHSTSSG